MRVKVMVLCGFQGSHVWSLEGRSSLQDRNTRSGQWTPAGICDPPAGSVVEGKLQYRDVKLKDRHTTDCIEPRCLGIGAGPAMPIRR